MFQDWQFVIIISAVIVMFLWLRSGICRLHANARQLRMDVDALRNDVASICKSLTWLCGRMGSSEVGSRFQQ